ncbi:hypothetical protein PBI_SCTP2_483 [Salicola phage SCTP-2]|nr:hypothetical protein PBI_SCTP2_483 [Salicola phage SCTP-2]
MTKPIISNKDLNSVIHETYRKIPRSEIVENILANPYNIQYVDDPDEQLQNIAVCDNGYAIQFIKNPSEQIIIEAIDNEPQSIKYLDYPSDNIQLRAIEHIWRISFYDMMMKIFSRDDEEKFNHDINKMKIKYGPMG